MLAKLGRSLRPKIFKVLALCSLLYMHAQHPADMHRDTDELPAIITDLEKSVKSLEKSQYVLFGHLHRKRSFIYFK